MRRDILIKSNSDVHRCGRRFSFNVLGLAPGDGLTDKEGRSLNRVVQVEIHHRADEEPDHNSEANNYA